MLIMLDLGKYRFGVEASLFSLLDPPFGLYPFIGILLQPVQVVIDFDDPVSLLAVALHA